MDDDEDAIYEQLLYAMFILLLLLLDIRLFWLICLEFKWWLKCASMPVFVFKLTLLLLTIILLPLLLFPFPFLPLELAEDFKLLIKYSSKSLCSFASSKFIFKLSMSSSSSLSKLLNELLHIWLRFFLLLFSFWIRLYVKFGFMLEKLLLPSLSQFILEWISMLLLFLSMPFSLIA